ncbi:MAG: nucleoside deaminase [Candidatus Poribacteria bacterium]
MFYPTKLDARWMREALREAAAAGERGDVPVGAAVVLNSAIVALGSNRCEADADPTAHAEVVAIRQAGKSLGQARLDGATLYVTVEPCVMCAGAIWLARFQRVVFGAYEPKTGAVNSRHCLLSDGRLGRTVLTVGGCLENEATGLLTAFFAARRDRDSIPRRDA